MSQINIPHIRTPFPAPVNPYIVECEENVFNFLKRNRLFTSDVVAKHYSKTSFGELVARTYGYAAPPEMQLIADFLATWAVFDDLLERTADQHSLDEWDEVMERSMDWFPLEPSKDGGEDAFSRAFADIWERTCERTTRVWRSRFRRHWRGYLVGCRWEAQQRMANRIPDLKEYIMMRRRFGGTVVAMDYAEVCGLYELPEALHGHDAFKAMRAAVTDLTLWGNDLFSAAKEVRDGNFSNLVLILQEEQQTSLQEAMYLAAGMIVRRIVEFAELEVELFNVFDALGLSSKARDDTKKYIYAMGTWTQGNLDWSRGKVRYDPDLHRTALYEEQENYLEALING